MVGILTPLQAVFGGIFSFKILPNRVMQLQAYGGKKPLRHWYKILHVGRYPRTFTGSCTEFVN